MINCIRKSRNSTFFRILLPVNTDLKKEGQPQMREDIIHI